MTKSLSLIGPDMFMDRQGRLFEKKASDEYTPLKNKYVEAEDRFVQKLLERKAGNPR
jgi:hypothetical protein